MAKAQTLSLGWFILSISMPTMDRGQFCAQILLSVDKMCVSFFSMWEFSQIMLTCTILSQNGEGPDPIFFVINPFNFDAHNGPGSIFQPLPSIRWKNVFSFSSLWEFSQKMLTCSILPQNGKELIRFFWWFIVSISTPTTDRGRFSKHFLLSEDKMCFPSSGCEIFLKKCWRWKFYLKMAKALSRFFWWFILSIPTPTMDRGRFSSHFLISGDKMCFPSSGCESFLKKGLRAQFYLKMADFFGDLSFQFQRPQWTLVDFPTTSSYPGIKRVFPSSVCESFPKKCWRGQFYLKMTKALTRFF